jgi:hypothetical protein
LEICTDIFARHKCQIDRNIKQGGYMTKDSGQQVSYGVPYELLPNAPASTSTNPNRKTIKKMEQQTQLRLDVKRHNPGLSCVRIGSPLLINFVSGIQCINFALMDGFLPRFAAAQYVRF